jgi:hypothetical protein
MNDNEMQNSGIAEEEIRCLSKLIDDDLVARSVRAVPFMSCVRACGAGEI